MTKVVLYIATSQDGFIADKQGGVDWLPHPDDASDEFGYKALIQRIALIVMGSHSYQQILGFGKWAWDDKQTYVFTSQDLTTNQPGVFFTHKNVKTFMQTLKEQQPHKDVWLLGGAKLIQSFAKEGLIDECINTVVPASLGEGIKLVLPYKDFSLVQTKPCSLGILQKFYVRKNG